MMLTVSELLQLIKNVSEADQCPTHGREHLAVCVECERSVLCARCIVRELEVRTSKTY